MGHWVVVLGFFCLFVCLLFFSTRHIIPFKCLCIFINREKKQVNNELLRGGWNPALKQWIRGANPFSKMLILRHVPFTLELFFYAPLTWLESWWHICPASIHHRQLCSGSLSCASWSTAVIWTESDHSQLHQHAGKQRNLETNIPYGGEAWVWLYKSQCKMRTMQSYCC